MALQTNNLYSESYQIIKDFLNDLDIDPRKRYRGNWIHSSMPNINSKGFDGYPFIVLRVDLMEDNPTFDGNEEKIFRVQVSIYCEDPANLDSISNKIIANFKDETKLTEFKSKKLLSSPINYTLDLKGKKILYRDLWFIFRRKL